MDNDEMRDSDSGSNDELDDASPQQASPQYNDSFGDPKKPSPGTNASSSSQRHNSGQGNAQVPHGLQPRSCVTCRKRKVKCDKSHPCANCKRAGIECIFPKPGRAPRRSKKAPDHELLARLRRLEGVVQKMGKSADVDGVESPEGSQSRVPSLSYGSGSSIGDGSSIRANMPEAFSATNTELSSTSVINGASDVAKLRNEIGRLVVDSGKSRYVSNKFWTQLTSELAEMQELLEVQTSDDEPEHGSTPGSGSHGSNKDRPVHQEFIFGYSSVMTTLRILHPHPRLIMTYWSLYKENIDPVLRLLHKPTTEEMFKKAATDLDHLPKATECIMFAVYLTVITSMSAEDCRSQLDVEKEIALQRYRYAAEQALAKANLVETQELKVLQACMLFLAAIRRIDGSSFSWAMTGLMLRISQRQGIHRDGTNFGLCPFDTEERRRLWWQMATFDGRVSDDQGIDPMVFQMTFDTKIPLNINDEDIWPGIKDEPVERERPTDMVFDLTRYEIGNTIRKLKQGMRTGCSADHRDQLIDQLRERLETKYLRYCDMSLPLEWVTVNICRLVLAKIWLMAHYPLNFQNGHASASEELRQRTFVKSVDIIRYTRLLETQHKTLKWGWMFRTYSQWHAAAFAFDELRRRTTGPEAEEGWRVMEEAFKEWDNPASGYTKSILWKPICRLRQLAKEARRKALDQLHKFPQDGSIGPSPPNLNAPLDRSGPNGGTWMGKPIPGQIPISDGMFIPNGAENIGQDSSLLSPRATDMKVPQPTITMAEQGVQGIGMGAGTGMMPMGNYGIEGLDQNMGDMGFLASFNAPHNQGTPGQDSIGGGMGSSPGDLGDSAWLDGMGDMENMSWDENLINSMVAAQPIDVNLSAVWGDPVG